jgi:general secretion pathway protein C
MLRVDLMDISPVCVAVICHSDRRGLQEVPRAFGFHDNRPMKTNPQGLWWPRIAAFVLAGLAGASAVYWGLKWPASGAPSAAAAVLVAEVAPANPQALARALGGGNAVAEAAQTPPALAVASLAGRLALVGVVANRSRGGAALISVDGKPARPYRIGARVEDALVLQSVAPRRAVLAERLQGPASITLELPALAK